MAQQRAAPWRWPVLDEKLVTNPQDVARYANKNLGALSDALRTQQLEDITRSPNYNTKIDGGLIADTVWDDAAALLALVNGRMQPAGGILDVVGIPRIASNITIPKNVTLNFLWGAYLAPDLGVVITLNGGIRAGLEKIFGGGGNVKFGGSKVAEAYPQWWGALADDVNDDAPPIMKFWGALVISPTPPIGRFPAGVYRTLSNLVFALGDGAVYGTHTGIELYGTYGATLIRPGPAVTKAVVQGVTSSDPNGLSSTLLMRGFLIDGSLTSGAIGMLSGENSVNISAYLNLRDIDIYGFHGVGAIGWKVKDLVGGNFENIYVDRCTTDHVVRASDGALPTVIRYHFCRFREADGNGVELYQGYRLVFEGVTTIEANWGHAVWVVPTAGENILWVTFEELWLELNCRLDPTQYQIHVDGTLGGTVEVNIKNTNWSGAAKSLYMKNVHNVVLDTIYPANVAGSVLIDVGVNGFADHWPENNVSWALAVINNSPTSFRNLANELAALHTEAAWAAVPALQNGWVAFGAPYAAAEMHKDESGWIHLRGLIKSGVVAAGTLLFTLPVGSRPNKQMILTTTSNDAPAAVLIDTAGVVKIEYGASATWFSLDGLSFRTY